jgi:hypothetical protein
MIRKSTILLAVFLMLIAVLPACSDSDNNAIAPGTRAVGTIQGLVFDIATGDPIDNAVVTITSTPFATDATGTAAITVKTMTNPDGSFKRTDISNGVIVVRVAHDGYKTPDSQTWALSPGGTGTFMFDMAPGQDPIPEFEGDDQWARPPDWSDSTGGDY